MRSEFTTKDIERFWAKVDRSGGENACWLWVAARDDNGSGYGIFTPPGYHYAHRFSWALHNGPIPDGLFVLHNCPGGDNPSCINPAHLWIGTTAENMADMVAKGRQATGDRNGSRAHPDRLPRGEHHWSKVMPERIVCAEKHGMARLTWAQVRMIRAAFATGTRTRTSLAHEFGITVTHVVRILLNKSWRE